MSRGWREELHPRGRDGAFARIMGLVDVAEPGHRPGRAGELAGQTERLRAELPTDWQAGYPRGASPADELRAAIAVREPRLQAAQHAGRADEVAGRGRHLATLRAELATADQAGPIAWRTDASGRHRMPTAEHERHLNATLNLGHAVLGEYDARLAADPDVARLTGAGRARREREILLGLLGEIRPMGGVEHRNVDAASGVASFARDGLPEATLGARPDWPARLTEAGAVFPADWLERSAAVRLAVTSSHRPHFSNRRRFGDGTVDVDLLSMPSAEWDGGDYVGGFSDKTAELTAHELAHRMETLVPGLSELEFTFVRRRATGPDGRVADPELLNKTAGGGYEQNERTFRDAWAQAYAGKTYEDGTGLDNPSRAPWEVFAVGVQDTFGRSANRFGDRELQAFTIGALLALR